MKKFIFLCTGNTCRSPMAKMIMEDLLDKYKIKNIEVDSRGLSVFGPSPVSPNVENILSEENIKLLPHSSTLLSEDDLTDNTIVLTMTSGHKQLAINRFPQYSSNFFTLAEYVGEHNLDIDDPYGGGIDVYRECFFQIDKLLNILAKNLPRS